jgi:hypothetical protein
MGRLRKFKVALCEALYRKVLVFSTEAFRLSMSKSYALFREGDGFLGG